MRKLMRIDTRASDSTNIQSASSGWKIPFWKIALSLVLVGGAVNASSCAGPYQQLPQDVRATVQSQCSRHEDQEQRRRCEFDGLAGIAVGETADSSLMRRIMSIFGRVLSVECQDIDSVLCDDAAARLREIALSESNDPDLRRMVVEALELARANCEGEYCQYSTIIRPRLSGELLLVAREAPELLSDEYWYDTNPERAYRLATDRGRGSEFRERMIEIIERALDASDEEPSALRDLDSNRYLESLLSIAANEVTEPNLRRGIMEYCFNWMVRSNWVPYHRFTDEADVATFLASPIGIMATGHHVFDPRNPFYAPPERVLHFGGEPFGAVRDSWFPREYLGDVIYGRFVATAPILVAIDDVGGLLYNALALYLEDSNCLFMVGEARTEADKRHKMAHELHHLCSRLGGGSRGIRWINEHGEPMVMTQVTWFNEGVTEILAQQMTREHGYEPTFVGYSYEPIVAFYLQQLVGLETLKIAYFTGDFTEVRRIVNQRVGEGTFEQILQLEGSPRVASSAALEFLVGRLNAAGIFYSEWERNSIITQARSELTED